MLVDLCGYKCPQLFVLFKVSLKKWATSDPPLMLLFDGDALLDDVTNYLTSSQINFSITREPNRITIIVSGRP